jgi:DNA-binding FrmR family transcriptional regulator
MESSELTKRINRLIGQLKGIQKMAEDGRECTQILQQVSAVKKAIDGLSTELVSKSICSYVKPEDQKKVEEMIERAISL